MVVETGGQRPFHFADDFLTKQWVPGPDQREVAMAVAKEKELQTKAPLPDDRTRPKAGTDPAPERQSVRGVVIVDFRPRSSGQRAGMRKGDIIIEYHGATDLTVERFRNLTVQTKREKARPIVVLVRDGVEHTVQVPGGSLGITILDTNVSGSFQRPAPRPEPSPDDDKKKGTKHKNWT